MQHMDMNWLMLIGVEIKYKSEVFKYLWHNSIYFEGKDTKKTLDSKIILGKIYMTF